MMDKMAVENRVEAVLRGNTDAFHDILTEFGPPLRAFLATQMFQISDVDDIAQQVFIVAYRNLHTFRLGEDFGAWLRGIARNKLKHYFEHLTRRADAMSRFHQEGLILIDAELDRAASGVRALHLQAMLTCIGKLPARMRQVIRSWLDGGKAAVLAEELQTSVASVYQLQHRALALLRVCITKELSHEL